MGRDRLRISVVLPAYNAEDVVGRAVESVLAQTRPADEVIVVDDGSSDDTSAVVRGFGAAVRCLRQENQGPGAARNTGAAAATGEWVAFLDCDDVWMEHRLAAAQGVLADDEELRWTAGNLYLRTHGSDALLPRLSPERAVEVGRSSTLLDDFVSAAAAGVPWEPSAVVFDRRALLEVGGFRADLDYAEDLDLALRFAERHPRIGFVPEAAVVHSIGRPDSLSRRHSIARRMEVVHTLYGEHRDAASERGVLRDLKAVVRGIALDHLGVLVRQGDWEGFQRVARSFGDLLPRSQVAWRRCLGVLPRGPRIRLLDALEWRLRAVTAGRRPDI